MSGLLEHQANQFHCNEGDKNHGEVDRVDILGGLQHVLAFRRFALEQLHLDLLIVVGFQLRDLELEVEKLGFNSELVEDVHFFGEELHEVGVVNLVEAVQPQVLQ